MKFIQFLQTITVGGNQLGVCSCNVTSLAEYLDNSKFRGLPGASGEKGHPGDQVCAYILLLIMY